MNLLKNLSIKTRLLCNSGLLIVLFLLALLIYAAAIRQGESSSALIVEYERAISDQAHLVNNLMDHARGAEKDFRLYKNPQYVDLVEDDIQKIFTALTKIEKFAKENGEPEMSEMAQKVRAHAGGYHTAFKELVAAFINQGLSHEDGLQGRFRKTIHLLSGERTAEHLIAPLFIALGNLSAAEAALDRHPSTEGRELFKKRVADFQELLENQTLINQERMKLRENFTEYQRLAARLPETIAQAEHDQLQQLAAKMRTILSSLYVPDLKAMLLEVRRDEKDYLLRREKQYADGVRQSIANIIDNFNKAGMSKRHINSITQDLKEYQRDFDLLVAEDKRIADLDVNLKKQYQIIENDLRLIINQAEQVTEKIQEQSTALTKSAERLALLISALALLTGIVFSLLIIGSIAKPLQAILEAIIKMSKGDYSARIKHSAKDETGVLSEMFNRMAEIIDKNNWLAEGRRGLGEVLREDKELDVLGQGIIVSLCKHLKAEIGTIFVKEEGQRLRLAGSYCYTKRKQLNTYIEPGVGLTGEAVREKELIVITEVPADYIQVESSLGSSPPRNIIAVPALWQGVVLAVFEIGTFLPLTDEQITFLRQESEAIAIAINSTRQRNKTLALLQETQRQAEELQTQQEELKTANEELEEQTQSLRQSEEELKSQQEELQVTNEELEEKTETLERQQIDIKQRNRELEAARADIENQARELTETNRYKSEFMANMSHELRTPLNSLLLLSRNLARNKDGNLKEGQVESAQVIYNSGMDLLRLINDILDLAKVEAGRMDLTIEEVALRDFADWLEENFRHLAEEKKLAYSIVLESTVPEKIKTDRKHLEQVLRNLVANAIKFTQQGEVTVRFALPVAEGPALDNFDPRKTLAISVCDTGIGIPLEKQHLIFEAFQQMDGSTARKYGGTGLGLTISKNLATLLGGRILLTSEEGKGATFTLYLPFDRIAPPAIEAKDSTPPLTKIQGRKTAEPTEAAPVLPDDRDHLSVEDKVILIIEDDLIFAGVLMGLGREKGFKCLVAATGASGLFLAEKHHPGAIILDIRLPDINGWLVLETLKSSPALRHIPVHVMSAEEKTIEAFKKGAIGFLSKPISEEELQNAFALLENASSKQMRDLLVVEDDPVMCREIIELIGNGDVKVTTVQSGKEAIKAVVAKKFDCMILDLGLPDMTGFVLLDKLAKKSEIEMPPVIVYTGRELTREEEVSIRKYTETVIVKGVKSEERLLDETALFLHRVVSKMPEKKRRMVASLYDQDAMFTDKKILLVDDDMRNAFALSKILEERGMKIIIAHDGGHALKCLEKEPEIDLVLMDIMMPVMDGYETTRRIRAQEKFWNLPIIALTAKAMADDMGKCLDAGANDYLAKPVEEGRLLSMMRVWLYR
ncbi:MAG: response regulator [Proteobacteria bacterium]|nr:response regulator [Pseudomonadota bacterium]MBU1714585.1 response regulator [Pseudomonadota bacterium]